MPIVFFRCSKCMREFNHRDEAKECEKSHIRVRSASAKRYTLGAYPFTIDVTFADGSTKVYILEDMAHTL